MALKKTIVQPNGVTTEYHKITYAGLSDRNGEQPSEEKFPLMLEVLVRSFLNAEYRKSGNCVDVNSYSFTLTSEEETQGIREVAYNKLKTIPEFEGAEDC